MVSWSPQPLSCMWETVLCKDIEQLTINSGSDCNNSLHGYFAHFKGSERRVCQEI